MTLRKEENSYKQSTGMSYIYKTSSDIPADSGNEARKKKRKSY